MNILEFLRNNVDLSVPIFIYGDFNINPINVLSQALSSHGFKQMIQYPTHQHGNIIDHVYCNFPSQLKYFIHPVHFSDHDAILSLIKFD